MGLATADSGNFLAYNFGRNPAVNFNFMLRVEGVFDLPCRAVRAFQRENEYEYIQEGGLNDYVHMRRKPISKPFTFQVERYVGTDILDPLANGTELVLPVILYVNRYRVYGDFVPVRMYVFTGCTVMAKEYGELNAEKAGLLVETTTIAYREMVCVENVAGSFLKADPWDIKEKDKNQSANHPRDDEKRAEAKKWEFDTVKQEDGSLTVHTLGNDKTSAVHPTGDEKRAEVKKWGFNPTVQADGKMPEAHMGNGQTSAVRPASDKNRAEARMWEFQSGDQKNGAAGVLGNGKTSAVHPENKKAESKRWAFDAKKQEDGSLSVKKMGNNKTSAVHPKDDIVRPVVKKWEFHGSDEKTTSKALGNGKTSAVRKESEAAESRVWKFESTTQKDGSVFVKKMGNEKTSALHPKNDATHSKVKKWKFKKAEKAGNGEQSAVSGKKDNERAKASEWKFKKTEKAGNGKQSAVSGTKDNERAKAVKWPPKRSAVDVAEFLQKSAKKS